jgi:carbonic anhydrase
MMVDVIFKRLFEGNKKYQMKMLKEKGAIEVKGTIPRYPILIITCMDPRIDVNRIFQFSPGDVFVLRNAGNIITEDVFRSILIAIHEYEIKHVIILGHLDCGMTKLSLKSMQSNLDKSILKQILTNYSNVYLGLQRYFRNFSDELKNIENQIHWFREPNVLPQEISIKGMLYDPSSGWVFDFDEIRHYGVKEKFYEDYKSLIEKKENDLRRINLKSEEITTLKAEVDNEIALDSVPNQEVEEVNIIDEKGELPLTNIKANLLKESQFLTKIQMPKIYIPKISVNIPKIYKKQSLDD